MDLRSTLKSKYYTAGRRSAGIWVIGLLLVLFASAAGLAGTTDGTHAVTSAHAAIPRPTPPDKPLDQESASAMVDDLKATLDEAIEDEAEVASITAKWDAKTFAGKTRDQILASLFADVRSVVKDKATQDKIWASWKDVGNDADPETRPVTPDTTPVKPTPPIRAETDPKDPDPTTKDPAPANPDTRESTEELIDLGAPPLSDGDMDKVMKWIATRMAAQRLPFCWKQSYGRTAGIPMICKPGYHQDTAGLCYKDCAPGERGIATFCYKNCPEGLPDDGLYCRRQGEYARGAGYVIWNEAKCNAENPQGCEKSGALWYPKCKPGFAPFGCCLCKPACPAGWENIGVSCKKPSYAREVLPLTECPAGYEKNGQLCYPICKNDFAGNGPVCWQKCPGQQAWDCGAACSTNQKECAFAVLKQVTTPIMAVISIVTLGTTSGVTGGVKAATKAAEVAVSAGKLAAAWAKIKNAARAAGGSVEALVGGAKNLANIKKVQKIGGKIYVAGSAIGREVNLFSKEFAGNFDEWTTPGIAKEIDERFGPEAAFQVKRQWGLRHLSMMFEADGFATGKNVLSLVSIADPTGVVAVAEAFMHPVCKSDSPFPTVNLLYDR